ncbi:MAG: hypothetical protein J6A77_03235 [Lachnospiraceae bacterium]|nr:hypothetical protein [Lachnospiraceae bacterium]
MVEVTKELLKDMMERYNIGKKPLSRLLGWGDTTVMRYLDGVEPNPEFAKRIEVLAGNPWTYLEVLEQNKDKVTDTAYRKSRKAVFAEIFCDRSTEAMQYVVAQALGDIAPYRVMTVLYYAQVCSLVFRGLPLFEEEADFSPGQPLVYPRLYGQMKQYGIRLIQPETGSFSAEEQECLKQVYQVLNGYSPNALKALLVRAKRRIRRHLKESADHLSMEDLKNQYETAFKKAGAEAPGELKKFLSEALKRTEG